MKIAYLYILSLCFLLLGGYCAAYGILPNDNSRPATKRIGKTQLVKLPVVNQDPVITHNTLPLDDKQTIVSVVNDDDDFGFRRRYVLLVTSLVILAYASFLNYLYKYFKNRLYSYKQLLTVGAYKYLLQGALRI
ncbi:hypothetical protein GCM10027049_09290 [Mucilaginibacter puniceus]